MIRTCLRPFSRPLMVWFCEHATFAKYPFFPKNVFFFAFDKLTFFPKDRFFFQCWIPKGIMQSTFVNINLSSLLMSYTGGRTALNFVIRSRLHLFWPPFLVFAHDQVCLLIEIFLEKTKQKRKNLL